MSFKFLKFLKPQSVITDQQLNSGLRWLTLEGMVSMGFSSIIGSGFLAAYALALGANNLQIGLLAAIPSITQMLQIAAVLLIEKIRWRKAITVLSWLPAQLLWLLIAAIPFLAPTPSSQAILMLLGIMIVRGLLSAITNCGWNTWVCDLVPKNILGNFFARRSILSTLATVAFGLAGAYFVDFWGSRGSGVQITQGYSYAIAFGALFMGLMSPVFMSLMPEPLMQPSPERLPIWQILTAPLRDRNFRWLLGFFLGWNFASNLALPFLSVYMLQRVGIPISMVIVLYVISQFFNILFLRIWGMLIDKFGNKVVLSLSTSLYLLVILGWLFTMMPDRYFLTMPLLVILHIFAGIASAGVGLASSTIGLKIAPRSQATAYLSGISLASNIGAGLGPMLGGLMADFFSQRQFNLNLAWSSPNYSTEIPALIITGFGFLFVIAFALGFFALNFLTHLREEGEVEREVVLDSLMSPIREIYHPISGILPYHLYHNSLYKYLKHVPLPGLDVALSVVTYEIGDFIRLLSKAGQVIWKSVKKYAQVIVNLI